MFKFPGFKNTLGLLVISSLLLSGCSAVDALIQGPTPIPYVTSTPDNQPAKPTVKVERGDVVRTVSYSGRIVSKVETQLQFQTAGRVEKLLVQQGDEVKKGDLLAQLQINVSEFDIRKAEIALDQAKLIYQQADLMTPAYQKDREVVLGLKKADVDLAQLALDQLNSQLELTKLTAPSDGIITALTIAESDTVEPFKTIMILADPKQVEISAILPAADLEKVAEKMPVSYSLANDPANLLPGVIRRLPLLAISSTQTDVPVDYSVRISLDSKSPTSGLALGTPVKLLVDLDKREGVLWLPPAALSRIGAAQYVYVQNGGKQSQVEIQVGLSTTGRVEILSGLTEGQVVVLP